KKSTDKHKAALLGSNRHVAPVLATAKDHIYGLAVFLVVALGVLVASKPAFGIFFRLEVTDFDLFLSFFFLCHFILVFLLFLWFLFVHCFSAYSPWVSPPHSWIEPSCGSSY